MSPTRTASPGEPGSPSVVGQDGELLSECKLDDALLALGRKHAQSE